MSRAFLFVALYVLPLALAVLVAGCGPVDRCSCRGDRCACTSNDGRCLTIRRHRNGPARCFPESR